MAWRVPIRVVWQNLAVVALLLAAVSSSLSLYVVGSIQNDRRVGCGRTYEGVREIFQPFLSGAPANRVLIFNERVDQLKADCRARIPEKHWWFLYVK